MRPFEKVDWYGFAGASEQPGKPALIGYAKNDYIIVIDIRGIEVFPTYEDGSLDNRQSSWYLETDYASAKAIGTLLEVIDINEVLLKEAGFGRC